MQRSLAPDRVRVALAVLAAAVILFAPVRLSTLLAICGGAVAGLLLFRKCEHARMEPISLPLSRTAGAVAAVLFCVPLLLLPLLARHFPSPELAVSSAFYRSGALVFGGGHVVLPLLEDAVVAPGWVGQQTFLAGYGAAQAMPGPLFSIAAYLGAAMGLNGQSATPILLGLLASISLFAPGLLAMTAVLPFWSGLRNNRLVAAALRGINASVAGVLIAALYRPLWTVTVHTALDFWLALSVFTLLSLWKVQPWIVVLCVAGISILWHPS